MAALSPVWRQIESFYFEAMLECMKHWSKPTEGPLPGFVHVKFTKGPLSFIDYWTKDEGATKVSGNIYIIYKTPEETYPIWYMSYSGKYPPEVFDVLREALYESYIRKEFNGGRGHPSMISGTYEYWNLTTVNSFILFEGVEKIIKRIPDKIVVGQHEYSGGMLRDIK